MSETWSNARIVVVDDDDDIRQLVAFTLERRGYAVIQASAGDEGLDIIRARRPDAVVMDVMMPGMTGIDVTRELRRDAMTSAIPVILLSARGQAQEIEDGLASGATAYLVKPFSPKEVGALVWVLLESSAG